MKKLTRRIGYGTGALFLLFTCVLWAAPNAPAPIHRGIYIDAQTAHAAHIAVSCAEAEDYYILSLRGDKEAARNADILQQEGCPKILWRSRMAASGDEPDEAPGDIADAEEAAQRPLKPRRVAVKRFNKAFGAFGLASARAQ